MKFGILSTATIARTAFAPAVAASEHDLAAVASRDESRAEAFADEFDVPVAHGSYEDVLADDTVDAVYVPLPNGLHAEWTKRAADAGKHVLCEKPLARDATEAREVVDHCRNDGVALMEGFMWRYHPRTERAAQVVADYFDDVRSLDARFAFPLRGRPDDVRLDPDLAGGSLMDVGCYAVNTARLFLGTPDRAYATATDTRDSGVDTALSGVLEYEDGRTARISCGFDTQEVQRYRVEAASGWLEVEHAYNPEGRETTLRYAMDGRTVEETFEPTDQFRREVDHFADAVDAGAEPRTDGEAAVENMRVIDALYESANVARPVNL